MKMLCGNLPPYRLLFSAISISALCVFPTGYHLSVVNIPQVILEQFVNQSWYNHYNTVLDTYQLSALWAIVANILSLGGIFGAWSTMFLAERYGRKFTLLVINNAIAIVGSLLMGFSKMMGSMEMLTLGRLLIGFNSGLATCLIGMYLTECSPTQYRGLIATFINLFITTTTLIGQIIALPQTLGTVELWPFLLALAGIPAFIQLAIAWNFPESPKHLLLTSRKEHKAKQSVKFFHGDRVDIGSVLDEFRKEQELAKEELSLREALSDIDLLWPIFISAVINVSQITTGITAIFTYSTSIFLTVGIPEHQAAFASMALSVFNVAGAVVSLPLMDRYGRRPLMLIGLMGCLICDIVFMVFSLLEEYTGNRIAPMVCLVAMVVHVTIFNIGPGPIAWFISSESTPQSVRSIGASVSITINWMTTLICGMGYLPLQETVGASSFSLFIVPTAACIIFLWYKMPETKNRTIHEVMKTWVKEKEDSG